jgi:hypothetical protein
MSLDSIILLSVSMRHLLMNELIILGGISEHSYIQYMDGGEFIAGTTEN